MLRPEGTRVIGKSNESNKDGREDGPATSNDGGMLAISRRCTERRKYVSVSKSREFRDKETCSPLRSKSYASDRTASDAAERLSKPVIVTFAANPSGVRIGDLPTRVMFEQRLWKGRRGDQLPALSGVSEGGELTFSSSSVSVLSRCKWFPW
jgi:hypothetical protein